MPIFSSSQFGAFFPQPCSLGGSQQPLGNIIGTGHRALHISSGMGRSLGAANVEAALHVRPLVEVVAVVLVAEEAARVARHGEFLLGPDRVHVVERVLGGVAKDPHQLVQRLGSALVERQLGNAVVHKADQGKLGAVTARLVVPATGKY